MKKSVVLLILDGFGISKKLREIPFQKPKPQLSIGSKKIFLILSYKLLE